MSTNEVFALRREANYLYGKDKLNKLYEALNIANKLYRNNPSDTWIQRALAWTLVDLCKYHIETNNTKQAARYFNMFAHINCVEYDEILETQKTILRPKIDKSYEEVEKASELSKEGKHKEAFAIINKLIAENSLSNVHHESYGWIIYRYISKECDNLTSLQVRTLLYVYIKLNNERPSMLHSMMLNFALKYSKEHPDLNLYNFFKLWNPIKLRPEDKTKQYYNSKEISSLLTRVFREFVDKEYHMDINYLTSNIIFDTRIDREINQQKVLNLIRKPMFWQIFNAHKENKHAEMWSLFEKYNNRYSEYGKSKWHSEILNLAERFMQGDDEWKFLEFFKKWNPNNFMSEDWEEVKVEDNVYRPLAIKSLKKAYEIIKNKSSKNENLNWLLEPYSKAIAKYPDDEWIKREKALLFIWNNEIDQAIKIYKELVLALGDKAYIWNEFSSCFDSNIDLKIGMLSKAIDLEKNEDFLGDIRLELAGALIEKNLLQNASIELSTYKKHREKKGWILAEKYDVLYKEIQHIEVLVTNNQSLYKQFKSIAEEFAYQDIEWTEFVLVDSWKDKKNKKRYKFNNREESDFSIRKDRFDILENAKVGNIFSFKIHKMVLEDRYIPLLSKKSEKQDWSILDDQVAVVDYINVKNKVIHTITSKHEEIFFKDDIERYKIGDFIQGKRIVSKFKDKTKIELKNISIIDKKVGVEQFPKAIAIVDHVNQRKNLFHFVVNRLIQGIVRFYETDIRPKEGDFLEIRLAKKYNKNWGKTICKAIDIRTTTERDESLIKEIKGFIELKYKFDRDTMEFDDLADFEKKKLKPDFAFIKDYYVPRYVLQNSSIDNNCYVMATAIFAGDKWKVIKVNEVK